MLRSFGSMFALAATLYAPAVLAQNAANGAIAFKKSCSVCHAVDPAKPSTLGPNLARVAGRKAGSLPGYAYSPAMAKAGFVWDAAALDRFLAKPQAVVPGTRMGFAGITNPADRKDVIAFLKAQSAVGKK